MVVEMDSLSDFAIDGTWSQSGVIVTVNLSVNVNETGANVNDMNVTDMNVSANVRKNAKNENESGENTNESGKTLNETETVNETATANGGDDDLELVIPSRNQIGSHLRSLG